MAVFTFWWMRCDTLMKTKMSVLIQRQLRTATINIELRAGQIVRIEYKGSSKVGGTNSTGTMLSWFTGHLLYAL